MVKHWARRALRRGLAKMGVGGRVGALERVDLGNQPAVEGLSRQHLLRRRAPFPVLDHPPTVAASSLALPPEELVLGAHREGEAKVYPTSTLRAHHIVNDRLAGEPFVVTF
jgi:Protein of unknown function (DUF3179)